MDPGKAFIEGYEFETLISQDLKIDKNTQKEIVNKYERLFPCVAKNVYLYTIPLFVWIEYRYEEYQYGLTLMGFSIQFIISVIASQFLFYWAHRMMHTKYLKKYHNKILLLYRYKWHQFV